MNGGKPVKENTLMERNRNSERIIIKQQPVPNRTNISHMNLPRYNYASSISKSKKNDSLAMPPIVQMKPKYKPAQSLNMYMDNTSKGSNNRINIQVKESTYHQAKYYQNSVYIKDFFKSINQIRKQRKNTNNDSKMSKSQVSQKSAAPTVPIQRQRQLIEHSKVGEQQVDGNCNNEYRESSLI